MFQAAWPLRCTFCNKCFSANAITLWKYLAHPHMIKSTLPLRCTFRIKRVSTNFIPLRGNTCSIRIQSIMLQETPFELIASYIVLIKYTTSTYMASIRHPKWSKIATVKCYVHHKKQTPICIIPFIRAPSLATSNFCVEPRSFSPWNVASQYAFFVSQPTPFMQAHHGRQW